MTRPKPEKNATTYTARKRKADDRFDRGTPARLPPLDQLGGDAAYDPRLAYALAVVSTWSYSDGQTLANKLVWYGLPGNTVQVFTVTNSALQVDAKAYLVLSESGRTGVLAFTGTEPDKLVDVLTDANAIFKGVREKAPGAEDAPRAHAGFHDSVEVLWSELSDALRDSSELERLYVTGHSLGGAMAVLAAMRIAELPEWNGLVRGVYTYGQPAVGDLALAREGEARIGSMYHRHRYGHDVVPALPPKESDKYFHFGRELTWSEGACAFVETARGVDRGQAYAATALAGAALSFLARRVPYTPFGLARRLPLYSIDDHGPNHYVDTTRAVLGAAPQPAASPRPMRRPARVPAS